MCDCSQMHFYTCMLPYKSPSVQQYSSKHSRFHSLLGLGCFFCSSICCLLCTHTNKLGIGSLQPKLVVCTWALLQAHGSNVMTVLCRLHKMVCANLCLMTRCTCKHTGRGFCLYVLAKSPSRSETSRHLLADRIWFASALSQSKQLGARMVF